ncbi:DegT/DnrJ/EryC1/StrS family aminotransferase [Pengzhenrongella sicca]|uniref:DegT/DnrJ/EryC1/StrS family aminotransferase n=1 Tax=Pengzhenrongella sicca TaxID=2819238 RepID=A0A8A4ZD40_9MICO|nr:DegT/DnrJ/EryC1/StrS family aminotransferase [Pengzhenrongella sicca]QTE29862.1 DegT/DnrJ/EryC1/StrS family aminotransferase [Pengzhenrongella sicca]
MSDSDEVAWVPFNDLSRSIAGSRAELVASFAAVLDSGWLVQGPQHDAFERELAAYVGVTHALGVACGTDALELALRAVMPAGKKTVVTAANCGAYTLTAARRAGFGVRFGDIDPVTLCLDPEAVTEAIDDSVGVVVVTHLYGRAADVKALRLVCDPRGIAVVEDCAQALGATGQDGRVGALATAAAVSFYPTKNLGALGDGGAVLTSSDAVAVAVRELRQYGWRGKYTIATDGGRNSRLDEVQAAILRNRLPGLDAANARRRAIISAYAARSSARVRVLDASGQGHVGHLAVVLCEDRDLLRAHLAALRIRTDIHFPVPDHRQPAFAREFAAVDLPVTEWAAERILSVPNFPELTTTEVERVCAALESF